MSKSHRAARRLNRALRPKTLVGLSGEIHRHGDRGSISVPGIGGGVPWKVVAVNGANDAHNIPAWADIVLGRSMPVRINPEIIEPPYFRLCDCLATIHLHHEKIAVLEHGAFMCLDFQGTEYLFSFMATPNGERVYFADTRERCERYSDR